MPVGKLTPIPISPRTRNVLAALVVLAVILVGWRAPAVPRLVLAGAAVALVLSFPVRLLSRAIPRGVAIALVMVLVLAGLGLAVVVLVPIAIAQLGSLAESVPSLASAAEQRLRTMLQLLYERQMIDTTPDEALAGLQRQVIGRAEGLTQDAVARVFNTLSGAVGALFQLVAILLVATYLLVDGGRFKTAFVRRLPLVYQDDALEWIDDAGQALSRYLTGILVSLTFQGTVATIVLLILDVPYAVLLGLWTAVGAIVPVVGSYIGGVPSVIAALFVSPLTAVLTALTYVVINMIDGNVIAPRVQGQAIRVHPLLIFLAVIAGGQIAGLWGALIAVPTLAVLRVTHDFLNERLVVREPGSALPPPILEERDATPKPTTVAALAAAPDDRGPIRPAP